MPLPDQDDSAEARLREILGDIYAPGIIDALLPEILGRIATFRAQYARPDPGWVDETDVMLITYGNSIRSNDRPPLAALDGFLSERIADVIGNVHILPFYPWSSDDGFSVIDYRAVDPDLGEWRDIGRLADRFGLMFDAVINHISKESAWFQGFLAGDPQYSGYFHVCDPTLDYSDVIRPRALPLLTAFRTRDGEKHVWTTFSDDQIDLNYANPQLLLECLEVLLFYAAKGARFLRLDAIGFLWKRLGTSCMHLPETHAVIRLMRQVIDAAAPGVLLITETNVPHADNVGYFGDGGNEAHMVYQFPLPPLTLYAFQTGNAQPLSDWAAGLEPTSPETTFFNFLSSHDGIGVRPVEGILPPEEVAAMAARVEANGGRVSARAVPGGGTVPYELNITFLDAVARPEDDDATRAAKFLAAQTILLSVVGVPGIYIHSLLGSRNDYAGLKATGRNRSINREQLELQALERDLADPISLRSRVLAGHRRLLAIRRGRPAFHPNAPQRIVDLDPRVFSLVRERDTDRVWAAINVSDATVDLTIEVARIGFAPGSRLIDLIGGSVVKVDGAQIRLSLPAFTAVWIAEAI
ncbi:MAG: alpha-amylase family glycosyl hydrolase [Rhodobacter sp.]|nr:alpha-amylase family glycosyl hydrolase [Rhodobacter sp.]